MINNAKLVSIQKDGYLQEGDITIRMKTLFFFMS